jgi:hypothetical protein
VAWLPDARQSGRDRSAVALLFNGYHYRVIFMQRAMPVLSQRQMLIRRGEDPNKPR